MPCVDLWELDMSTDLNQRLVKARTSLVLEHPFIGMIALNMPQVLDDTINPPTACTNGKQVRYHPEFVKSLTDEELKFLVAHECMHPMLEHPFRRGGRDPKTWNKAGDYVINQHLTDDNIGKMPESGLLNKSLFDAGNGTTDGIYSIIEADESDGSGAGGGHGDPLDNCEDSEGTPAEQAQDHAEWKVKVAQAAQSARMMGKMSAGMTRLVDEVLNPKVDWRDVLRRFVQKCRDSSRTFARPSRRFISQKLYMPSVSGETMGELVFAIDCSGSINQHELSQFSAELTQVKEDYNPKAIHVLYFDSEVSHYDKFTRDDDLVVAMHGGGGTDFEPVFRYIEEQGIEPVATVVLTDLCCSSFGQAPQYPVLWVTTDRGTAPFGEIIEM
jgi:predicted metal-dependent peptidase